MRKLTDCIFVGISALVHVDVIFTRINALVHVDIIDIIFIGTDSSRLLCRAGDAACFELLLLLPTSSPPGTLYCQFHIHLSTISVLYAC